MLCISLLTRFAAGLTIWHRPIRGKPNPMQPVSARIRRFLLLPVLALAASPYVSAQEVGTVTLLKDTPLSVIRGYTVLEGVEGMRLRQGDILQTGPKGTAQAQLEFSGDAVVEIGPSSQVFLFRQSGTAAELVLLTGWLKGETTSGVYRYSSPLMTATTKGGNVLLHATADSAEIFVERGAASVSGGGGAAGASSADKLFFTRRTGKPMAAAGRPGQDFVERDACELSRCSAISFGPLCPIEATRAQDRP